MSTAAAEPTTAATPYVRKPPPLAMQYAMGVWFGAIMRPAVFTLEKLGLAERVFGALSSGMRRAAEKKNPFRGYTPGSHDVFVATYAKSGTNWTMQIALQLIYHGRADYDHIHCLVPWPDTEIMAGHMRGYAIPFAQATHWQSAPERKRVIKSHYDWDLLPYSEEARYILVIRDPKDIFVSSYFFVKEGVFGPAMPTVDTWFKLFLSEGFPLGGSWAVNTAGYWAQRHRPNVLILSFKAMKRDLRGTVLQVADFLDVRVSDEVILEVCHKSSFEYMKRIDKKFHMGKLIAWGPQGVMMRKGTEGGSSELLSPERQREVDAHFIAELKRLGSDFPYEEFCDVSPELATDRPLTMQR